MSTSAASLPAAQAEPRANRKLERAFYAGMSVLMLASVLLGFSHTYYMAGLHAPNALIHIHGAIFSAWILLLLVQTALITTRKVKVHRALGVYGFGLAVLMCVIGPIAAIDQLRRHDAPFAMDPRSFFIIPVTALAVFAFFVAWSWRARFQPAAHKRLILLATIALMDAAIGRWPFAVLQQHPPLMGFVELGFVVLMGAFDLLSIRRIHKTTAWGFLILMVVLFTRVPLAQTRAWLAFAGLFLRH